MESLADLYPGARASVYLDSAAVGIVSTRVSRAMRTIVDAHVADGAAAGEAGGLVIARTREALARLVGGRADRVAYTQNTTTGLALVVNGLHWRGGDNVVVPAQEFASNSYAWVALEQRGVEVRRVPFTDDHAAVEDLVARVDERTRVLSVSAVQYSTGYRYPLDALARACRAHGALFVVDGIQALGALMMDVAASDIDVLASGAHKWLLGPFGVGFVHLSDRALEELTPSTIGWAAAEDPFAFRQDFEPAGDARRFESGTWNAAGIAGLGASVELALELGPAWIEERVLETAGAVADACAAAGLQVRRAADPARHSGIVVARSRTGDDGALHARLMDGGVRCSMRGKGVRFSPHYFTTREDVETFAAVLESAVREG